jgi:hypothetical protein
MPIGAATKQSKCAAGVYILENIPPWGGGMSTDVMGKNMKREEKGRKGKEN